MEPNHYAPPVADLETQPETAPDAVILPFEDKAGIPGLAARISGTFQWILFDRERAGAGFAASADLGRPLGFLVLVAYLPTVLPALLALWLPRSPFWAAWLHQPQPAAPQGPVLVIGLVGVVLMAPIGLLIGALLTGLLDHAGLWMVRGTRHQVGLPASLRSVTYTATILAWVALPFALGKSLPGLVGLIFQVLSLAFGFLVLPTYQGLLLARTHRVEAWRGVAGAWLPNLLMFTCAGACLGFAYLVAGDAFRQGLQHALGR